MNNKTKEKIKSYTLAIIVLIIILTGSAGISYFLMIVLGMLSPLFNVNLACGIEDSFNSKLCQYLWEVIPIGLSIILSISYLIIRKIKNKNEPLIENLANVLKTPKKEKDLVNAKKPFRAGCVMGFLISIVLSIGFGLVSLLFQTSAKTDMNFAQMYRMGGENIQKFIVVYGILTLITIVATMLKRYPKSTAIFLTIYWILAFLMFRSISSSCNEAETIKNVKLASHPVLIYNQDGLIGSGSGLALSDSQNDLILTNYHIIEGPNKIKVGVGSDNKQEIDATIFSQYPDDDIALLKVNYDFPHSAILDDSDLLKDAETLYAIGWPNDPNGEATITRGVMSRRISEDNFELIQTDAPINPGNSGGPLINKCGVIGMNTAKMVWSDDATPTEGTGYALSSNFIQSIIYKK